jgi:hypothetical protein
MCYCTFWSWLSSLLSVEMWDIVINVAFIDGNTRCALCQNSCLYVSAVTVGERERFYLNMVSATTTQVWITSSSMRLRLRFWGWSLSASGCSPARYRFLAHMTRWYDLGEKEKRRIARRTWSDFLVAPLSIGGNFEWSIGSSDDPLYWSVCLSLQQAVGYIKQRWQCK